MRTWSPTLLQRIVAALIAVAALPIGAVFSLIDQSSDDLLNQYRNAHMLAARSAATRLSAEVDALRKLATAAGADPDLVDVPGSGRSNSELAGLVEAYGDVAAAGLFVLRGEPGNAPLESIAVARHPDYSDVIEAALHPETSQPLLVTEHGGARWLRLLVDTDTVLAGDSDAGDSDAGDSDAGDSDAGDTDSANPGAPGATAEAPPRLVLALLVLADYLHRDTFRLTELGAEADLVLVNAAGAVITGSQLNLDGFPPQLIEDAAARSQVEVSGNEYVLGPSERVVGAYAAVNGTPWVVLSKQSSRVAASSVSNMRRIAWRIFGTVLVLTALLGLAAWTGIVRPIRKLIRSQRQLAGNEDATVRGNEIHALEEAFKKLEENLYDRDALSEIFLGRYQVQSVLGSGAMGTVFRGWDPRLKRSVALKTVKIAEDALPSEQERLAGHLETEAVTLAQLQHPNVVTLFDLLHEGNAMFLAMELVEGKSLERYLWQENKLPSDQVTVLGAALLRALEAAHARNLVHHDIKPANILLGNDNSIKLTDFGISQFLTAGQNERDKIFGTPGYLAPEALSGQGYGPAADLFATGVVLYECLVGKPPFEGFGLGDVISQTMRCEIEPPSSRAEGVSPELETMVLSLLAKEPASRPSDAATAAQDLERLASAGNLQWSPRWKTTDDGKTAPTIPSRDRLRASFYPTQRFGK